MDVREEAAARPRPMALLLISTKKWRGDLHRPGFFDYECTFIVLDKERLEETQSEVKSMIGDTNLYLTAYNEGILAETGIMIAESTARRKRMGWEAILMNIRYGIEQLKIDKFIAKISLLNVKSIDMFRKMGFDKESESNIFQEITLSRNVTEDWALWLKTELKDYVIVETEENY